MKITQLLLICFLMANVLSFEFKTFRTENHIDNQRIRTPDNILRKADEAQMRIYKESHLKRATKAAVDTSSTGIKGMALGLAYGL